MIAKIESSPAAIAETSTKQVTVMVVDDDRLVLATLSQGLRAVGFSTIEVSSGAEALQLSQQAPPTIAILDYDMPGISGVDVAQKWLPAKAFPFIFLSAYSDDLIVHRAVNSGAMAYLLKPIDPQQLVPVIWASLQRFADMHRLRGESAQLSTALQAGRETNIVVGLLMERLQLTESDAYGRLRQYARSRSRKISEVAADILSAADKFNSVVAEIGVLRGKSRS